MGAWTAGRDRYSQRGAHKKPRLQILKKSSSTAWKAFGLCNLAGLFEPSIYIAVVYSL
jgi:desulfoferrodoxin (superoxide reductase-like protein)